MFLTYVHLFLCGLVVIALCVGVYLLKRFTKFGKISPVAQQIIIGLIFGGASVFGTECGINIGNAIVNIRDSGPLIAGFIFGGPAGMIAGVIGGVERIFASFWGAGWYSTIACSVSTILAGIYGAVVRRWILEKKEPKWWFALAGTVIIEVLHLTLLFITHLFETYRVMEIIRACTFPMIIGNAFTVTVATLIVQILNHNRHAPKQTKSITWVFQVWLLVLTVSGYLLSFGFIYVLQNNFSYETASMVLRTNVSDVNDQILNYSNSIAELHRDSVYEKYIADPSIDLNSIIKGNPYISQINVITTDEKGVIVKSTDPDNVGFIMKGGPNSTYQSIDFQESIIASHAYTQTFQSSSMYPDKYLKYSGRYIDDNYYLQIGIAPTGLYNSGISDIVKTITQNRTVFFSGYLVIFDYDDKIISDQSKHAGKELGIKGDDLEQYEPNNLMRMNLYGVPCYMLYTECETYYTIAACPVTDLTNFRDTFLYSAAFSQIIVFAIIFYVFYILIKLLVVNNVRKINDTLALIISGDLNQLVNVKGTLEFEYLSRDINITVETLKRYIEQAASRIDRELAFAKKIQESSLPTVFPPFPERTDFDVYASMNPARQVGGDFYDFYFLSSTRFGFLVADVSGKGIPASMFMMESKTLLKNIALVEPDIGKVFMKANDELCDGNDANMFVTCWMGNIDLNTGAVEYANAGHNYPIIIRNDGNVEYLKQKKNVVLGSFEGLPYDNQKLQLHPGDRIFLYTDGVTESNNPNEELYGEDRLIDFFIAHKDLNNKDLLTLLKKDITDFTDGEDQFDDITMLIFEYKGN